MTVLLVAYLATLALHAGFVAYVLAGSGYALVQAVRRADDPLAAQVRDRLPFMLGCGITAGVAPLLFIQLLYQRRFYSANLLMGPRWMAVIPALIAGFYGLYVAKVTARPRLRLAALAVSVASFAFVAYSWSEQHELMQAEGVWQHMYGAGERVYLSADVPLRFALFGGAMATLFAAVAAQGTALRRRLAVIALGGRAVSIAAAIALVAGGSVDVAIRTVWSHVLLVAVVIDVVGWVLVIRRPEGAGLRVATAGGALALIAAVVTRELPRIDSIQPEGPLSSGAGGSVVFVVALVLGIAAIAWIVRVVRTAAPDSEHS